MLGSSETGFGTGPSATVNEVFPASCITKQVPSKDLGGRLSRSKRIELEFKSVVVIMQE
jgi:hypothetical protein